MNNYVKTYFPNAIEIARKCNYCNQPMYTVRYPSDIKSGRVYGIVEQCLNGDCWKPETEHIGWGV